MNNEIVNSLEPSVNSGQTLKRENRNLLIRRFFTNRQLVIGSGILLIMFIIVLFAPSLAVHDPYEINAKERLQAPSGEHYFGTDNLGRDLFSRVVYGARSTMTIAFSVTLITGIFAMMIGLYSAYYRRLDNILMRVCDGLMAFPDILLAIAIVAIMGPNPVNVVIAICLVQVPVIARVIRSSALVIKEQTYIEALNAQGASSFRIIWRHVAPNVISQLIIQLTYVFAISIIIEASLSFLGVGIPAPDPSWGNIIYDGKAVIYNSWWMTVFPGIFIFFTVLSLNLFGDGLRDLLDPQSNK